MIWHIFYTSDKAIAWSSNAGIDERVIDNEAAAGKSYVQVEQDDLPIAENYYVNAEGTGIAAKTAFSPTFSTTTPALNDTVAITGLPTGTEVFIDGTSKGTLSASTLNLTFTEPGKYSIEFKKLENLDYLTLIETRRYGQ